MDAHDALWDKYGLTLDLLSPLLGSIPKNKQIFESFVRDIAQSQEDERIAEEVEERGWTGFYEDEDGRPILLDYQLKGFFKEAGNTIKDLTKVKNLRSHINNELMIKPRQTLLADEIDDYVERPLRAMTMQGPRVSLVRSDAIMPGRTYKFEIWVMKTSKISLEILEMIVAYGEEKGLLQWRNGGYGRFKGTITEP